MKQKCIECWQAVPDFMKAAENDQGPNDLVWPTGYYFACIKRGKCQPLISDIKPFRGNPSESETIVLDLGLTITRKSGPIVVSFFNKPLC